MSLTLENSMAPQNQANYEGLYSERQAFLRWPADWILRFHNMYLRARLPQPASILDFGCGSGNNSVPFLKMGHHVSGVEVASTSTELIRENLEYHGLPLDYLSRVQLLDPPITSLPYGDHAFDFILSNQVHYYSTSESELHAVNAELARVLKPGGTIFVTMMGPSNYYIADYTRSVKGGGVHEVRIEDPTHRLFGVGEDVLLCRSEAHLRDMFREFRTVSTGHFDQRMFDMTSNFHYIFVGEKA